ncbi:hypothetical protein ACFSR7_05940 [Cohnella sp. GCM10020058]|uniref:hypothetical protein n=1 Tax=Cohnella sp. GCM10020058 TaxID=3317330 RepID=UPI0036394DA6
MQNPTQQPFLIGISYPDYRPGMKLYLHQEHEGLKEGDVVTIQEVSGFDPETRAYKTPRELYFIAADGLKIVWNEVKISCYIERNETTSFLESMFKYYQRQADEMLKDVRNYEWTKRNHEDFLDEKHTTLLELLIQYEYERSRGVDSPVKN